MEFRASRRRLGRLLSLRRVRPPLFPLLPTLLPTPELELRSPWLSVTTSEPGLKSTPEP